MQYLLDTHTILWFLYGDKRLSSTAKKILETYNCYYSYVSFWEISIKQSRQKLEFTRSIFEIDKMCRQSTFTRLSISFADLHRVRNLPFQANIKHNDPIDRLLISQAIGNDLTIVTHDAIIPLYDVKTIW